MLTKVSHQDRSSKDPASYWGERGPGGDHPARTMASAHRVMPPSVRRRQRRTERRHQPSLATPHDRRDTIAIPGLVEPVQGPYPNAGHVRRRAPAGAHCQSSWRRLDRQVDLGSIRAPGALVAAALADPGTFMNHGVVPRPTVMPEFSARALHRHSHAPQITAEGGSVNGAEA